MKNIVDSESAAEHKFIIYKLDNTKKGFVGQTTTKVLDLALEQIFFRLVLPTDGVGPSYLG